MNTPARTRGDSNEAAGRRDRLRCTDPVRVVHAVPGRVRAKVRRLCGDGRARDQLTGALGRLEGVRRARASATTGSVLVEFDPGKRRDIVADIAAALADLGIRAAVSRRPRSVPSQRGSAAGASRGDPDRPFWHALAPEEVIQVLGTDAEHGLSFDEALERLRTHGPNRLADSGVRGELEIMLGQFVSLPVGLLGISAAVSVLTGGLADAGAIVAVVLLNAGIGYGTERSAERTISGLMRRGPYRAAVLHDGVVRQVPAETLVVGDIVMLTPGSPVGADARLVSATNLVIDESPLTGESVPSAKSASYIGPPEVPLGERLNMVYMGTTVTGGNGKAVVVATGERTEIGTIQALVGETPAPVTPMQKQLGRMGTQLAVLSGAVCAGVFAMGLLRGLNAMQMLKTSISLAVAAVPEGLPAVATTTLALGVRKMRRDAVAVRRLDAIETLGSVDTLCLDKTGTLTRNRMTVLAMETIERRVTLHDDTWLEDDTPAAADDDDLCRLLEIVSLCNDTDITADERLEGSPTETALIRAALEFDIDVASLRNLYPQTAARYRSEGRPYMITTHETSDDRLFVSVKGSPSAVLDMCDRVQRSGRAERLSEELREQIRSANERLAGQGLRVLGAAFAVCAAASGQATPRLIWTGLIGMTDPLRPGMPELMRTFHRAGIRTVMITGDQSPTAYAIGRELDLSEGGQLQILDSTSLDRIDPELLTALVERTHVFARVSPAHKLQIVQALQRGGHSVAMTGDGINDGPALKASDIGVAMGAGGADLAREVADVVLEDDNLDTMATAVSQGRAIYANIRKTVRYLLSTNLSEIEVMAAGVAVAGASPLNPMQLLWINLISDVFPGLALALDPPEPDTLARAPRDPAEPIIRKQDLGAMPRESLVIAAGTLASYAWGRRRYGPGAGANTVAFMSLTVAQLLHALTCRSRKYGIFSRKLPRNRYLDTAIAASLLAQCLVVAVPGLRRLFGTTPLGFADCLAALAGATAPLLINDGFKTIRTEKRRMIPTEATTDEAAGR